MTRLSVEQLKHLKANDWVWIVLKDGGISYPAHNGKYYQIYTSTEEFVGITVETSLYTSLRYYDYGTKWWAYKNKEQADGDFRDISLKCCENCRNKGFAENKCEKLTKLFEENGLRHEDGLFPSYADRWHKRHELMKDYCCDDFDSRWLEYPIAVTEVECSQPKYNKGLGHKTGALVRIRPCGEEYGNKTYIGFYLGDLPLSLHQSFNSETHKLAIFTHNNPAIFVPQLNKIIFGCESWWGEIESEDELKDITDDCINNQWYVKALKELDKKE